MKRLLICVITALGLFTATATQAAIITYTAVLNGASEHVPNASPATGFATIIIDDAADTMSINVTFSGLTGPTTAAHIHCCTAIPFFGTAGVATMVPNFSGFPVGVTSGSFIATYDLLLASSYNPAFVTNNGGIAGAQAALLAGMADGTSYFNIHTQTIPSGEIRGFLTEVPEPGGVMLFALGICCLSLFWRRRNGKLAPAAARRG